MRKAFTVVLVRRSHISAGIVFLALAAWPVDVSAGNSPACSGDCNDDGRVEVSEIITGVRISLEALSVNACIAVDTDTSGTVAVSELVQAVGHALRGCSVVDGAVFLIRACASVENPDGQTFRALIRDPIVIATAESLIGATQQQIIYSALIAGDGGFNAPWSWHLDPNAVGFADFTVELCDSCPMLIEEDLDYWLEVVGQYCPWSTEVLAREH